MPDHLPDPTTRLSRRDFLKITAVAGSLLAGGGLLRRAAAAAVVRETRVLMGTVVNLSLVADDGAAAQETVAATFAEMERLIHLFDHRRPDGPLGRLNREGRLAPAPPELLSLLAEAHSYSEISGGAFDVTAKPLVDAVRAGVAAPLEAVDYRALEIGKDGVTLARPGMAVTLDGIGKGRVVDGAVALLAAQRYGNVLVEAGGDLLARGQRDGRGWQVGIHHPRVENGLLATLSLSGRALATSGDYAHAFSRDFSRHHIVDPRTGRSPAGLASVTVLAPTATAADALSTAVMVLGAEAGLGLLNRLPHVEGLLVTKSLELLGSGGWRADF